MPTRHAIILVLLAAALAGAVVLRISTGGDLNTLSETARSQVITLRLDRAIAAMTVGAALAGAGVILQSLLRNPLASPDILGPASGASLAVMLATLIGGGATAGTGFGALAWQAGPAVLGSMSVLGLVMLLARGRRGLDPSALVIVGAVISVMCGAGVVLVHHLIEASSISGRSLQLLVGAVTDETPRSHVLAVGLLVMFAAIIGCLTGRTADASGMSDDEALSVGVHLPRLRTVQFLLAGSLAAGAVVIAGPVGFVGLICPHAARLLLDLTRSRESLGRLGRSGTLLIASMLAGATLLVLADAGVRAIETRAGRVPLGVVTALVGGPTLIALLRGRYAARGM